MQEQKDNGPPGGVAGFPPDGVAGTEQPADRGAAFSPVQGGETTSGEMLLIEAYAAMWLVAMLLIWLSWNRQKGVEQRIAALRGAIEKVQSEMDEAPDSGEES